MRRAERITLRALPLVAASVLFVLSAEAANKLEEQLRDVERQIDRGQQEQSDLAKQATALATELATLRADSLRAAEAAQTHETRLSELDERLRNLSAEEAEKRAEMLRDHAHEAQLLVALSRLARNPPEAMALGPMSPEDAIRSGLLLGAAVPQLEAEARALDLRLADLGRLRATIERQRLAREAEQRGLEQEQQRLAAVIERKSVLHDRTLQGAEDAKQRLLKLSTQASDLRELLERLETERKAREEAEQRDAARREAERQAALAAMARPEPAPKAEASTMVAAPPPVLLDPTKPKTMRSFAKQARGAVLYPASGRVALRYGDTDEFGGASKGLTVATRPGAVVVAPFDGRIEFAGPFKGYGQILIIQHGDGYHSLLAGLDRIDGSVGDWLVAGEPWPLERPNPACTSSCAMTASR